MYLFFYYNTQGKNIVSIFLCVPVSKINYRIFGIETYKFFLIQKINVD